MHKREGANDRTFLFFWLLLAYSFRQARLLEIPEGGSFLLLKAFDNYIQNTEYMATPTKFYIYSFTLSYPTALQYHMHGYLYSTKVVLT